MNEELKSNTYYKNLKDKLEKQIKTVDFSSGEKISFERKLFDLYSVSRTTAP